MSKFLLYLMLLPLTSDCRLFTRDHWVDCRTLGKSERNPRFMYTLNGQREEWDPKVRRPEMQTWKVLILQLKNNDRVWNALQPALQLSSRLLLMNENFISGLQDITNRFWIEDKLFAGLKGQDRTRKLKFMHDPNFRGRGKLAGAQEIKDSGLDVLALSMEVLRQLFRIKLSSGFDMDARPTRHITLGQQNAPYFFKPGNKIIIDIDAELVWPLLVDKYTESEKLMANVVLATTITHEMMVRYSKHY